MSNSPDDFLETGFFCEPDNKLRQAIREQTTRVLRLHRRIKRVVVLAAFAACFVAGMATMYVVGPAQPAGPESVSGPVAQIKAEAPQRVQVAEVPTTAAALEKQALTNPDERVARLRKAGGKYLEEDQDYQAALRCYSQALNSGALEPSPDDTWLEMALKDARRKENSNAN
jgi:hypothetical protein